MDAYMTAPQHVELIEKHQSNWKDVQAFDSHVSGGVRRRAFALLVNNFSNFQFSPPRPLSLWGRVRVRVARVLCNGTATHLFPSGHCVSQQLEAGLALTAWGRVAN